MKALSAKVNKPQEKRAMLVLDLNVLKPVAPDLEAYDDAIESKHNTPVILCCGTQTFEESIIKAEGSHAV